MRHSTRSLAALGGAPGYPQPCLSPVPRNPVYPAPNKRNTLWCKTAIVFFGGEGTFTVSLALRSLGNRLTRQNYMVLVDLCQVLKGAYLQPKVRNAL